jgi:hypothetical protein
MSMTSKKKSRWVLSCKVAQANFISTHINQIFALDTHWYVTEIFHFTSFSNTSSSPSICDKMHSVTIDSCSLMARKETFCSCASRKLNFLIRIWEDKTLIISTWIEIYIQTNLFFSRKGNHGIQRIHFQILDAANEMWPA